jgi:hypothetical protein
MASSNQQVKVLKGLIWLYLILLLTEGALRKWALPSLSNILTIVRDPVVMVIYLVAMASGRFVVNGFVVADFLLAAGTFFAGLLTPDLNIVVSLIGLRCYFLHLPLIFVMERTLDKEDIWRIGKFLLWFAIPETILLVAQFYLPQTNWVNYTVGGQLTAGFSGAEGHARASGTFSFTDGIAGFYPLVVAALLGFLLTRRKLPLWLILAAAVSTAMAIPISINRTNALICAGVLLAGSTAVFALPSTPKHIVRIILVLGITTLLASWLPHFDEGIEAFNSRWVSATGTNLGGFQSNIVMRYFDGLIPPTDVIFNTPLLGYGVGRGTLMAQAYMTGAREFTLGESEWPRVIMEMGPVLGLTFILLRLALCVRLVRISFFSLMQENIWPLLFAVEAFFLCLNATWGQATILGFATFSCGLSFAASHMELPQSKPVRRRRRRTLPVDSPPPVPEPVLNTGLNCTPS